MRKNCPENFHGKKRAAPGLCWFPPLPLGRNLWLPEPVGPGVQWIQWGYTVTRNHPQKMAENKGVTEVNGYQEKLSTTHFPEKIVPFTPWKINGWFTYSHHPLRKENDLKQTGPWNYVPAFNLQGCTHFLCGLNFYGLRPGGGGRKASSWIARKSIYISIVYPEPQMGPLFWSLETALVLGG